MIAVIVLMCPINEHLGSTYRVVKK
jgi:hypothetical protein